MTITIEVGSIEQVLFIDSHINEFDGTTTRESIESKLKNRAHLILIAKYDGVLAGYKIGYALSNSEFYSWLGGVSSDYRKRGIATKLRNCQEQWAISSGYSAIRVKSMNRYPAMLQLLISSGYKINDYENIGSVDNSKIHFIKQLLS